jgi:hypothetical protein
LGFRFYDLERRGCKSAKGKKKGFEKTRMRTQTKEQVTNSLDHSNWRSFLKSMIARASAKLTDGYQSGGWLYLLNVRPRGFVPQQTFIIWYIHMDTTPSLLENDTVICWSLLNIHRSKWLPDLSVGIILVQWVTVTE